MCDALASGRSADSRRVGMASRRLLGRALRRGGRTSARHRRAGGVRSTLLEVLQEAYARHGGWHERHERHARKREMANKRSTAGGEGPHIGWRAFTCKFDRSIDRSSVACLVPANLVLLSAIYLFHSLLLLACPLLPPADGLFCGLVFLAPFSRLALPVSGRFRVAAGTAVRKVAKVVIGTSRAASFDAGACCWRGQAV